MSLPAAPQHTNGIAKAIEAYRSALTAEEQKKFSCTTPIQLLDEAKILAGQFQSSQSNTILSKLRPAIASLETFSKCIDVFVSSNPAIAAIIWGSIRCVITLAGGYFTYFDKVASMLEHISVSIDIDNLMLYEKLFPKFPKLQQRIQEIYFEIITFCTAAKRLFTDKEGKKRRSIGVINDILWMPFSSKFDAIIGRIRLGHDIIKMEAEIANIVMQSEERNLQALERDLNERYRQLHSETYKRFEDFRDTWTADKLCRLKARLTKWTNPSDYMNDYQNALSLHLDGSTDWLRALPEFQNWESGKTKFGRADHHLWLTGKVGAGKTIHSAAIIQHLENQGKIVLYHFCDYRTPQKRALDGILSSLLTQLLHHLFPNTTFLDIFQLAMQVGSSTKQASTLEKRDILEMVLQELSDTYIVIDGVDESDECYSISEYFLSFPDTMVLISSRHNQTDLLELFHHAPVLPLNDNLSGVNSGIKSFVDSKVQAILLKGLAKSSSDNPPTADTISKKIVTASNGMFLWAKLMVQYLVSPALSPAQRSRTISEIHYLQDLDYIYDRILLLIRTLSKPSQDLAKKTFLILPCLDHSLEADELNWLFAQKDEALTQDDLIPEFLNALIYSCGGLVEAVPESPGFEFTLVNGQMVAIEQRGDFGVKSRMVIRFIHKSVQDYLCSIESRFPEFYASAKIGHTLIAEACLQTLITSNALIGRISKASIDESKLYIKSTYPSLRYSSLFWLYHLAAYEDLGSKSASEACVLSMIPTFIKDRSRLCSWLEILYIFGGNTLASKSIESLTGKKYGNNIWSPKQAQSYSLINKLYEQLQIIKAGWGKRLSEEPRILWDDILQFNPNCDLFIDPRAPKLRPFCTHSHEDWAASNNLFRTPIVKCSQTSGNGKWHLVLSIWTPNEFGSSGIDTVRKLQRSSIDGDIGNAMKMLNGWYLRLEYLENTKSARIIGTAIYELDASDIHIYALRESGIKSFLDSGPCLAFPVSISSDVSRISVLNKLYQVDIDEREVLVRKGRELTLSIIDWAKPPIAIDLSSYSHKVCMGESENSRYVACRLQQGGHTHIMVYDLQRSDHQGHINPVWCLNLSSRSFYDDETITLHPNALLVAFSTLGSGVMICEFSSEFKASPDAGSDDLFKMLVGGLDEAFATKIWERLEFSACGNFLLASASKINGGTQVLSLNMRKYTKSKMTFQCTASDLSAANSQLEQWRTFTDCPPSSRTANLSEESDIGSIFRSYKRQNEAVNYNNINQPSMRISSKESQLLREHNTSRELSLEVDTTASVGGAILISRRDSNNTVIQAELTKLPNWEIMDQLQPEIFINPENRKNANLVLHVAPTKYHLFQTTDNGNSALRTLPGQISIPVSTIQQRIVDKAHGKRAIESYALESHTDYEEPRRKKPRNSSNI